MYKYDNVLLLLLSSVELCQTCYDQPPSYYTVNAENGDRDTPYTLYGEHNIPTDYQLTASHLQGYEQPYVQSNTTVVVNQPAGGCNRVVLGRPLDYMKISIFACIFCFWPTAIFAIFLASEARRLADAGDWDNARILSNRARYLVASSIILGIVGYAVSIYLCQILQSYLLIGVHLSYLK